MRIKEILKEKGMTAKNVSELSKIATPLLSNIINGKVSPSVNTLEKIANALGVEVWELFTQSKASSEFMALVKDKDHYYHATSVEELEEVVNQIKQNNGN